MTPYASGEGWTLYLGDCREILPSLAAVDCVLTDPPYSAHVHESVMSGRTADGWRGEPIAAEVALGFDSLTAAVREPIAAEVARLARRWSLVFSDVESCHLWRRDLEAAGLDYIRTGAWVKRNGAPQFTGDRPAVSFETITICHPPGAKKWNGGGGPGLWECPIVISRGAGEVRCHPTQKPIRLLKELVGLFTDPGETILDPFAGSGTTLLAARDLGRRSIGIEKDEKYAEIAARRLAQNLLPLGVA